MRIRSVCRKDQMDIVIFGTGVHSKVVIDVVEKCGKHRIAGLLSSNLQKGENFFGYPVLGNDKEFLMEPGPIKAGIVAIGDNWIRSKVAMNIERHIPDFHFITAIHPFTAIGREVSIGAGTVICAGAVINPATKIGQHCIVNTKASVDHDNHLGDFAAIMPGATTAGNVNIGRFSVVCMGAAVKHGVTIGESTVIGAGSTVLKDTTDQAVLLGSPARFHRTRRPEEPYL